MPDVSPSPAHLFVYGTLRAAFDGPTARWLRGSARHIGPASVAGLLYRVADYPGLMPGPSGQVKGDLFALDDAAAVLAVLDDYEECAAIIPNRTNIVAPNGRCRRRTGRSTPGSMSMRRMCRASRW